LALKDGVPLYIGESKSVGSRVAQHRDAKSPFCKSLAKAFGETVTAEDVEFHYLHTIFGRKDMEEYGMFSLGPQFNKSHKGRIFPEPTTEKASCKWHAVYSTYAGCWKASLVDTTISWHTVEANLEQILEDGKAALFAVEPRPILHHEKLAMPGVYLISRGEEVFYIGESVDLASRLGTHCKNARFSAFRRSVAERELGFTLKTKQELGDEKSTDTKRSHLAPEEEAAINEFLEGCKVRYMPVCIGRIELEEFLIREVDPKLNKRR
ncbi:MAG: GIY-YIG nuclease family protein, partial [Anaerovoracaceae bacterium]